MAKSVPKRRHSFCCCAGPPQVNKIVPLDADAECPQVVVDNFFQRGQADGASDNEKPLKVERHVSGTSFSTRTTIGDTESQAGLSEFDVSSSEDSSDSSDDSSDQENDEMKTVITEGGLSKVALDLDHPFAPYYEGIDEEDIPGLLLSDTRLRGAGFYVPDRSTLNRSLDSQMSTYTDFDPALNREDTPVPGKRHANLIHHLAKRKTCPKLRRGPNVLGRHVPMSSELETMDEHSRAATPAMSTYRTPADPFSSQATLSTARTLPAEDVDSLASSDDDLSAIGEMSEQTSSSSCTSSSSSSSGGDTPRPTKTLNSKHLSRSHNLSNNFMKNILGENAKEIKLGSTFPMSMGEAKNDEYKHEDEKTGKPDIPPKPPRRKTRAFTTEKPPQSADPFSKRRTTPRCADILGPAPRTADIFSRYNNTILAEPSLNEQRSSYGSHIVQDLSRTNQNKEPSHVTTTQHPFALGPYEPSYPGDRKQDTSRAAWQFDQPRHLDHNQRTDNTTRQRHDWNINTTDVDCRPKAARPRRPGTASDTSAPKRPPRKSDARRRAETRGEDSTDGLDEESHPDGPDFGKFTTIIVI